MCDRDSKSLISKGKAIQIEARPTTTTHQRKNILRKKRLCTLQSRWVKFGDMAGIPDEKNRNPHKCIATL
jgi:hypothetical protein